MSKSYIPAAVRRRVAELANHQCSYCQTQAALVGKSLQIDHVIPEAHGGSSTEENLCLACSTCNQKKGTSTVAVDPATGDEAYLFNPRQQVWREHFHWDANGLYIVGLTTVGRVTVAALDMNNPYIVRSRRLWIQWGVHPPQ